MYVDKNVLSEAGYQMTKTSNLPFHKKTDKISQPKLLAKTSYAPKKFWLLVKKAAWKTIRENSFS